MIKKVTIVQVDFYTESKDKKPLTYVSKKTGKTEKYKKVRVKVGDGITLWGAAFSKPQEDEMRSWQAGQEVELDIEQNGEYFNFNLPRKSNPDIESLKLRIDNLENRIKILEGEQETGDILGDGELPEEGGLQAEQIPF